jgi:pimeloyl-ACP methyl ester carboxylesterase
MSIDVRVLRRQLPEQVVLLHGLFCNGAYWIPWLEHFSRYQVTLVGIDYAALLDAGTPPDAIAARLDALVGGKPAHLVAHSFGCWPGAMSRRDWLSRSFICPTFAAASHDTAAFRAEVARRIGASTPEQQAEIGRLIDLALDYKARNVEALRDALRFRESDAFYLPSDDPYFRYVEKMAQGRTHASTGGHFDAGPALAAIAGRLA